MRLTLAIALLLSSLAITHGVSAQAGPPAYAPYPAQHYGLPGRPVWSAGDEDWYRQNRAFALAGKILTVAGIAITFAVGIPNRSLSAALVGSSLQYGGQFMWAGSELRGAKEMRRRGYDVRKAPGIAAVFGAALFSPLLWVAGPIQSARLRQAHASATGDLLVSPSARSSYGLGLRVDF